MAANIVGDAYVVVRAITSSVERDIRKAFDGADREGERAGSRVSNGFRRGFNRGNQRNFEIFSPNFLAQADAARARFQSLSRVAFFLQPALTALGGAIGVLITTLTSLVSVVGFAAGPAFYTLAAALSAAAQAALTLRLAFSGVAKAIQAGTKASKASTADLKEKDRLFKRLTRAQEDLLRLYDDVAESEELALRNVTDAREEYADAIKRAREELQQLAFDSEDAAINEQRAALELEKAREALARVADLPPNSRARKEAELAFAQADLNYRRAIDANNDLKEQEAENAALGPDLETQAKNQEDVLRAQRNVDDALRAYNKTVVDNSFAIKRATEDLKDLQDAYDNFDADRGAVDQYTDAMSELSEEARAFVKYMVDVFIPSLKALKEAAGKFLFPQLIEALDNLRLNLFPTLIPLLEETGDVLGKIAKKISETITTAENLKRLETIWRANNRFLLKLGDAAANLYEIFLILLQAAIPLLDEFGDWVVKVTAAWKATLKADEATGKLAKRFDTARLILKDLATIFGNTFRGIGNIFAANVGPGSGGQIFLNYLKDVTKAFENLKTIDGKPIREFFADAAENGTLFLDLLGNIIGGFITLADNPELGVFFKQLNTVTDIFQRIGENLTGSLPAFGEFLIQFSLFIEQLTESGSVIIFFDTLSTVLRGLNDFLNTEFGQTLLKISAAILPLLAAFGLIIKTVGFFGKVVAGAVFAIVGVFQKLGYVIALIKGTFGALSIILGVGLGPIIAIGVAIAALVATIVLAYEKSEIFRNALKTLVEGVFVALKKAFNEILEAIKEVMPSIQGFGDIFKKIGDFLGKYIVPILEVILVTAINAIAAAIKLLIRIAGGLISAFQVPFNVIKGIFALFRGDAEGAANFFRLAFEKAVEAIKRVFGGIGRFFKDIINGSIIRPWNRLVGGLSFKLPSFLGGGTITLPRLTELAEGGIVYPKSGGTIARIAEAGRPERVEPLDSQGLSERDRALIVELAKEAGMGGIGKQVSIIVNPSKGMDERELAAIVARQISYSLRMGVA